MPCWCSASAPSSHQQGSTLHRPDHPVGCRRRGCAVYISDVAALALAVIMVPVVVPVFVLAMLSLIVGLVLFFLEVQIATR